MISAVCDANGRRWRVEGPGWTMQPEGTLTAAEAEAMCRAAASSLSNDAVLSVLAERRRQIEVEGWTPEHDDAEHDAGDFAAACAAYAHHAADQLNPHSQGDGGDDAPHYWPFEAQWWKPTTPRRDLVKALALGLAELERIDRRCAEPAE